MRTVTVWACLAAASVSLLAGCSAPGAAKTELSFTPAASATDECAGAFAAGEAAQRAARAAERDAAAEVDRDGIRSDEENERMREVRRLTDKAFDSAVQETLRACSDVSDWLAGAAELPTVVGLRSASELSDAVLRGACSLLEASQVCMDASARMPSGY